MTSFFLIASLEYKFRTTKESVKISAKIEQRKFSEIQWLVAVDIKDATTVLFFLGSLQYEFVGFAIKVSTRCRNDSIVILV